MQLLNTIKIQLKAALWECCPPMFAEHVVASSLLDSVTHQLMEDAIAFNSKDPAAYDVTRVIQTYTSFKAVLHYRLANGLDKENDSKLLSEESAIYAALISSRGKLLSGAELHHRCQIGRRFILDHGIGTVVGETTEIGDDCYILGGVTLGAYGIACNPTNKRHPTIGDRVQIGAFTGIFGDISIGDDVFIGSKCTITESIPSCSSVTARPLEQVVKCRKIPSIMRN